MKRVEVKVQLFDFRKRSWASQVIERLEPSYGDTIRNANGGRDFTIGEGNRVYVFNPVPVDYDYEKFLVNPDLKFFDHDQHPFKENVGRLIIFDVTRRESYINMKYVVFQNESELTDVYEGRIYNQRIYIVGDVS
jgi:hypothetical protein